jgi:hypothetical protein
MRYYDILRRGVESTAPPPCFLGLSNGNFGPILGWFRPDFRPTSRSNIGKSLGQFCGRTWADFGTNYGQTFESIWGWFWGRVCAGLRLILWPILGRVWDQFWADFEADFGLIVGWIWGQFQANLGADFAGGHGSCRELWRAKTTKSRKQQSYFLCFRWQKIMGSPKYQVLSKVIAHFEPD